MKKIFILWLGAVAFIWICFGWGCAGHKDIISRIEGDQPIVEQTPVGMVPGPVVASANEKYKVVRGDCLWSIAGKVYQDAFQWPALFKANRDQIQDPDLIYPKQVLAVDRGQDSARCRALALKTPKYHRHTRPRKVLPVNYF